MAVRIFHLIGRGVEWAGRCRVIQRKAGSESQKAVARETGWQRADRQSGRYSQRAAAMGTLVGAIDQGTSSTRFLVSAFNLLTRCCFSSPLPQASSRLLAVRRCHVQHLHLAPRAQGTAHTSIVRGLNMTLFIILLHLADAHCWAGL